MAIKILKDPATWLKMATALEKPQHPPTVKFEGNNESVPWESSKVNPSPAVAAAPMTEQDQAPVGDNSTSV